MKNKTVQFRVSAEDHSEMKSRATEAGLTVSDYLRQLGTSGGKVVVSASIIQSLIYQVRSIGNNINQLSHKANMARMSDDLFDESLREIRTFVTFLRRVQGSSK